jgi:drug/metabolite transporter (DMT)-like permease
MNWFLFALAGYFLYAFVSTINKVLLRQPATTKPVVYTFYVGVLSIFTFLIIPFGSFQWPGALNFFLDVGAGFLMFVYLLAFYCALDKNEASRAVPLIGGLMPVLVLSAAYLFLAERLNFFQFLACALLIMGGVLISFKKTKSGFKEDLNEVKYIFLAIGLGAFYWILMKYLFSGQGFVTGFAWTRLGLVLAAFCALLIPSWRQAIAGSRKQMAFGLGFVLVFSKILAGAGSLLVHLALSQGGSASLVNAMAGTEYAFLLLFTFSFSKKYPQLLKEKTGPGILALKISAILAIAAGLAILGFFGGEAIGGK